MATTEDFVTEAVRRGRRCGAADGAARPCPGRVYEPGTRTREGGLDTKRFLLWLWRVLPLTGGMQFAALWLLNPKFLLGVIGVVVDNEGRVLLLKHSYRNDCPWGLPSGWVKRGEQPGEAIARELREEVGLVVRVVSLLDLRIARDLPRTDITLLCRPAQVGAPNPTPKDVEIQQAAFFRPGEFPGPLSHPQLEMIERGLVALGFDRPR